MTAFPYSQYAHGDYRPGARRNTDMVSGDLFAQLAAQQRRNEIRYAELLAEIDSRIGYERRALYLDELPEMGGNEMIATLEAKVAALDAEAAEMIAEGCPTAHAHTEIIGANTAHDEPPDEEEWCIDCGKLL